MNALKVGPQSINGTVEFVIAGNYFKLLEAAAALDIELMNDGRSVLIARGVEAGFYQRIPFTAVRITTTSAQAVAVLIAPEEGGSDRITGSIQADQFTYGDALAAAASTFVQGWVLPAVAANNQSLQLFNPVGSQKVVYVDAVQIETSLAGFIEISRNTTPITTLIFNGSNRNINGAASVAEIRSQSAAGLFGNTVLRTRMPADVGQTFVFKPPLRLAASVGVIAGNSPVNADLGANWFWREKTA